MLTIRVTKRKAVRSIVLVLVVIVIAREDWRELIYKLTVVVMHGVWEFMDAPLPSAEKSGKALKMVREGLFDLIKK